MDGGCAYLMILHKRYSIGGKPAAFPYKDKRGHSAAQSPTSTQTGPNPLRLLSEDHLTRITQGHRHQRH